MEHQPLHFKDLKVGAILNTSSGSCDEASAGVMLGILKQAGVVGPRMWCGSADQMQSSFAEALSLNLDVLIVLGGDGTIRGAAQVCAPQRPYLIPLPGGTVNVLPHALYGNVSWEDALKDTLAKPSLKELSAGQVGDEQFFIAAVVGAPALMADAREAVREGAIKEAVEKGSEAIKTMLNSKVQYSIQGVDKGEAETVAVICPLISQALSSSDQRLEVAVIDVNTVTEVIGLVTTAAFGKWRDDAHISLAEAQQISFTSKNEIPAILDGERINLPPRAEITFVPLAVSVLVPEGI